MTGQNSRDPSAILERRTFFESLVRLRASYPERGTDDLMPVMGIRHAIAAANASLAAQSASVLRLASPSS